ncbi:alpha-1,3-mannosyl-glycoprotein 4-beta-N-acetylglucosaminyltransferase B-like [Nilaparvata lugens]|uniref:alpha-1,3-mannosyl-glycoprotein 4-beta-N-acetylglucosaminyltransferase B-like n=1 Tax=Nilaparvata lugens TaxID=108931 RepID=UPI00193D1459|nr:alpha-1,3-mannosyl-glycoprotein 4-beta-N-acetylglucosaminyltransferase B-like [Nilaparvata lugens]
MSFLEAILRIPLTRKQPILYGFMFLFGISSLFTLSSRIDMRQESDLVRQLVESQTEYNKLDDNYRKKVEEVQVLRQQLETLKNDSPTKVMSETQTNSKTVSHNVINLKPFQENPIDSSDMMRLPSGYDFLPHLLLSPSSINPSFILSKGRTGVSVAFGIPTVKREDQIYVLATLQNLLDGMSQVEKDNTIIIVLIAETNEDYILQITNSIQHDFQPHLDSGLIEVIVPAASFYPDLSKIKTNYLNEPTDRFYWRTKQNLDFAYLMMYSHTKSKYYVQLEDDILAIPNFATIMVKAAHEETATKESWVVIDFCNLGFIGKLFKSVDLPQFAQFLLMFHTAKPVDWLLHYFISTLVCHLEKDHISCNKAKSQVWIHKPPLFQHVGTQSSLKGKVQNLKDSEFGKVALYFPHQNPDASVYSEAIGYKRHTLQQVYTGKNFFWSLQSQYMDHMWFVFKEPLIIKRYLFRSGNAEHPSYIFCNTSVEVLPKNPLPESERLPRTDDGYIVVGAFNSKGVAEGTLGRRYGLIRELRLTIYGDYDHVVILSEIHIEPEDSS